jgi:hypothetical protein
MDRVNDKIWATVAHLTRLRGCVPIVQPGSFLPLFSYTGSCLQEHPSTSYTISDGMYYGMVWDMGCSHPGRRDWIRSFHVVTAITGIKHFASGGADSVHFLAIIPRESCSSVAPPLSPVPTRPNLINNENEHCASPSTKSEP